uniref:C2 domain-containing protein n=1 Tax=Alexandrium monilatum TaxID=311494 RepID=A0A7S4Q304_9DINO
MDGAECEIRVWPQLKHLGVGFVHVRLKLDAHMQQSVCLAARSKRDFRILKSAVKCSRYISESRPDEGRMLGLKTLMRGIDSPAAHLHKAWDELARLWRLLREMDVVNEAPKERFQQSVLLEVWSPVCLIQSRKFLGECWLPNLSEFTPQMKDTLLSLKAADFREDAQGGPSRWGRDKEKAVSHPGPHVQGKLFVSVGWTFPIADPAGSASTSGRMFKASTGSMQLRITKGKRLGAAEVVRAPDPQVLVWIRNDHTMTWREAPSAKTRSMQRTRNPHFNHESSIELIDGPVEMTALQLRGADRP